MNAFSPTENHPPETSAAPEAGALPTAVRGATLAPIVAIRSVAPRHFLLTLEAPAITATAQAGQFVHILSRPSTSIDPFLRRAFSIMAVRDTHLDVLFRVEGRGTAWLAERRVGEIIDLLGPLGRPFDLKPFQTKPQENIVPILVGGGVGVPPMIFLAETFQKMGVEPIAILGARSATEVLGRNELQAMKLEARICTDDGSLGHAGRVTDLLEKVLQAQNKAVIYSCGPWPMLRAVAGVAERYQAPCQVSMEENMPCGIGVCNGCVVAMHSTATDYERYRRICIEGPAVWASEVDWGQS